MLIHNSMRCTCMINQVPEPAYHCKIKQKKIMRWNIASHIADVQRNLFITWQLEIRQNLLQFFFHKQFNLQYDASVQDLRDRIYKGSKFLHVDTLIAFYKSHWHVNKTIIC